MTSSADVLGDDLRSEIAAFNVDDDDFDLFRAAVLIGRIEDPSVNVEAVSREVGAITAAVRARMDDATGDPSPLTALCDVLFDEFGFCGDTDEYDAPHNSFIHQVVQRRRGVPIALSVLTCEVAQRAGLDAYGVPFPGHFLVAFHHPEADGARDLLVIDPFHKGQLRTASGLAAHLSRLAGRKVQLGPEHLAPAEPKTILSRMLNNLRGSYARRRDPGRLVRVLSRMLILEPGHPGLLLERARARRVLLDEEGARRDALAAETRGGERGFAARNFVTQLERETAVFH